MKLILWPGYLSQYSVYAMCWTTRVALIFLFATVSRPALGLSSVIKGYRALFPREKKLRDAKKCDL